MFIVKINGDSEQIQFIMNTFQNEALFLSELIKEIKTISANDFIIKCNSVSDAALLEEQITLKYGDKISIKKVKNFKPTIKIPGLSTTLESKDDIKKQLINRNKWIRNEDFDIKQTYTTLTDNTSYTTVIAECSLELFDILLIRKFVSFGFMRHKIYEYVDSKYSLLEIIVFQIIYGVFW